MQKNGQKSDSLLRWVPKAFDVIALGINGNQNTQKYVKQKKKKKREQEKMCVVAG